MAERHETIDAYLAGVPPEQRAALEALRATIRAIVPDAQETISYGLPTFRWHGNLVAFGAAKAHCALYPMSGDLIAANAEALAGFSTSKGAIRFQPDAPIPDALIRRIVETRMAENKAKRG